MQSTAGESGQESQIKIEPSWRERLIDEFRSPYMADLKAFLVEEKKKHQVFPKNAEIFKAFDLTPFDEVRVVILGQDPYHGPNQAHGLSFSVPDGVLLPPSLVNIYKELARDLKTSSPESGCLENWAKQGVLLLNSVLTVRRGQAASHQNRGWERFTDAVIKKVSDERDGVAFILWGSYAQKKGAQIDPHKHLILKSVHPSPLSAHRGFLGSAPFSQVNVHLAERGANPIVWN